MDDLAGAGKAGGEQDPIPPPPLTIPPNVKPEVLISPKCSISAIDAVFYQYSVCINSCGSLFVDCNVFEY